MKSASGIIEIGLLMCLLAVITFATMQTYNNLKVNLVAMSSVKSKETTTGLSFIPPKGSGSDYSSPDGGGGHDIDSISQGGSGSGSETAGILASYNPDTGLGGAATNTSGSSFNKSTGQNSTTSTGNNGIETIGVCQSGKIDSTNTTDTTGKPSTPILPIAPVKPGGQNANPYVSSGIFSSLNPNISSRITNFNNPVNSSGTSSPSGPTLGGIVNNLSDSVTSTIIQVKNTLNNVFSNILGNSSSVVKDNSSVESAGAVSVSKNLNTQIINFGMGH